MSRDLLTHYSTRQMILGKCILIYVTEGFKLRVRGGLLVALSYALDFHVFETNGYVHVSIIQIKRLMVDVITLR